MAASEAEPPFDEVMRLDGGEALGAFGLTFGGTDITSITGSMCSISLERLFLRFPARRRKISRQQKHMPNATMLHMTTIRGMTQEGVVHVAGLAVVSMNGGGVGGGDAVGGVMGGGFGDGLGGRNGGEGGGGDGGDGGDGGSGGEGGLGGGGDGGGEGDGGGGEGDGGGDGVGGGFGGEGGKGGRAAQPWVENSNVSSSNV